MYPSSPLPQPYSRDHRASPVAARISRSFFVPIAVFCPNKIALHRWYALEKHKHKHRPLLFILSRFVPQVALLASPNPSLLLFIACFQTTTYIHCAQRVPPSSQIGTLVLPLPRDTRLSPMRSYLSRTPGGPNHRVQLRALCFALPNLASVQWAAAIARLLSTTLTPWA